jgi:ABC-2 type transport system permease protein
VKLLAIARKDLLHEMRSFFALFMMIGAPLLIAGLLYFAFGGLSRGGAASLSQTRLAVVNRDAGNPRTGENIGADLLSHFSEGDVRDLLAVSLMTDETAARTAVTERRADVALLIPPGFSRALFAGEAGPAGDVVLFHDPALTVGPGIVRSVTAGFLDSAVGARIAVEVAAAQSAGMEGTLPGAAAGRVVSTYFARAGNSRAAVEVRRVAKEKRSVNEFAAMMKAIMVSMMVFFVFYTGANTAQSLVREKEEGTFARLVSTPTPMATVLAGKTLAIALTILVQVAVLLAVSAILFGITWGAPARMLVAFGGTLLGATGFGIMLVSFCSSGRQVGPVLGAGLTITGMMGGLFSNFVPGVPESMKTAALAVPQGWAARLWALALAGAGPEQLAVPFVVLAASGAVFFFVGVALNRRRRGGW